MSLKTEAKEKDHTIITIIEYALHVVVKNVYISK